MTTRWPRILLATLCLLAFAASASAEGAWVLQTAYPTATECTEAIDYREVLTPKNLFTIDRRSRTDLFLMEQSASTPTARSR